MHNVSQPPEMREGVANPGWLRPPFVFLLAILAGVAVDGWWPSVLPARVGLVVLGAACMIAAIVVFTLAHRTMAKAGTPVPGNQPTVAIVRSGPFRYSRNPIYLAFALLHLGLALAYGSAWLLVTLVPAVLLMDLVVIRREERYLEGRFGASYVSYKASVRRWI